MAQRMRGRPRTRPATSQTQPVAEVCHTVAAAPQPTVHEVTLTTEDARRVVRRALATLVATWEQEG